ncbi:cytochrome c biogenesis protein CcdA [bacterium]|nr:cytochrome c biogenesis protein CcdA [bacterium]
MIDAPLALAFAAGLVATVNPCGFAMLPAYLSYFIGTGGDEPEDTATAMRRSLVVGGVVSAGFLLVFGVTGVLITAGFRTVTDAIPWLALVVGVGIVLLGIAMLRGFDLTVRLPKPGRASHGRGLRSVFGFGVSYAIASLSCTLPVFLSVVALQAQRSNFLSGVATFLAYGAGMSMLLLGVTIALEFGRRGLILRLRSTAGYINRVAGAVLVLAGGYVVWFWVTDLTSGAGALGASGPFRFFEDLSQRAFRIVGDHPLLWGLGLGGLILTAVGIVFLAARGSGQDQTVDRHRESAPAEPRV